MNPNEIAKAFSQLKEAGKVKHFGVSNFTPSQFDLLNSYTPLVTNQVEVSITHRNAFEDGTLDQCIKHKIQPTAWSPLGGGTIFGVSEEESIQAIQKVANTLGEKHGVGIDQILLAWINKHPSRIVSVLGTSKIKRVEAALKALDIELSHEEWYELWQASIGEEVA